jgi:hypothetical protein
MQDKNNHTKWDPWFHFFLLPAVMLNVLYWGMRMVRSNSLDDAWAFLMALAFVVAVFKLRLNALRVQDRLIRLEERLRLARLLRGDDPAWAGSITEPQWVALRFASDQELPDLAERAAKENLDQSQIKEAIRQWRADHYRV